MKWLIADTYYPNFTADFYRAKPELRRASYAEQRRALMDHCLGTADFYSTNLKALGQEAEDVIANCEPLQAAWVRENGSPAGLPVPRVLIRQKLAWMQRVLRLQIERARPDVLYVQDLNWVTAELLRDVRPFVRLILGQTACPLRPDLDFEPYDAIFTSLPNFVAKFRAQGIDARYLRIAFEPSILERTGAQGRKYGAVFVGGFSSDHAFGRKVLERLAGEVGLDVWGYGIDSLPANSHLRSCYHGEAWGIDMYRTLASSRVSLNRHINIAEQFANNMRLYESTGVGALLVTDHKDNVAELFEPGKEIVTYRSPEDCVEKVRYYLDHEDERATIAAAGQRRTLRDHTYRQRMEELVEAAEALLREPRRHRPASEGRLSMFKPLEPKRIATRVLNRNTKPNHRLVTAADDVAAVELGWQRSTVASRQRELVDAQLRETHAGNAPVPYRVAADAVQCTAMQKGSLLEVGCGSGYYAEALDHLLPGDLKYTGLDYSGPMISLGHAYDPALPLLVGDASKLPLADGSFDVVLSGTVLLHVLHYKEAIEETARVARSWAIFHRTPVIHQGQTTLLQKSAYGEELIEFVFEERELLDLFSRYGLKVESSLPVESFQVKPLNEPVFVKTYVCRKSG